MIHWWLRLKHAEGMSLRYSVIFLENTYLENTY